MAAVAAEGGTLAATRCGKTVVTEADTVTI